METYSAYLEKAFVTINTYPRIGKARDDLRPGLRSYKVQHHIVFYHLDGEAVTVVRILHERMDATAQFT